MESAFQEFETIRAPKSEVVICFCHPLIKPSHLEINDPAVGAIILIGFASGTTPDRLAPAIKKNTDDNVPVFILTHNIKDEAGPAKLKYAAGGKNIEAGGVVLQKVNIRHLEEVYHHILSLLAEGVTGKALVEVIKAKYFYADNENPPPAEWETEIGIQKMRERNNQTLRRIGYICEQANTSQQHIN